MIIGTITVIMLFFGGGLFSLDVFKDAAKDVIQDKDRVKQIEVVTKEADEEIKALDKQIENVSKQLVSMNTNYNLSRQELDTALEQNDNYREQFQERLIQLRFQAQTLVTQKEWDAMYARLDSKIK